MRTVPVLSLILLVISSTTLCSAAEFGWDGEMSHYALESFGRDRGQTQLQFMPHLIDEEDYILFGDYRGFINNGGKYGANIASGFRYLEPNNIFLLGINGAYDIDQTSGEIFQQVGVGIEGLTRFGRLTSNYYMPLSDDEKMLSRQGSNYRFDNNQILFDDLSIQGQALEGFDLTLGVFLPGEFSTRHRVELSSGWYHFEGSTTDPVNGFKLKVEGKIASSLNGQMTYTNDPLYGSNASLGISWRFGNTEQPEDILSYQFRRPLQRNSNVIVKRNTHAETDVAFINPDTGLPYTVQHVSSLSFTSDGTAENPWTSISDAQSAGADVIFVHAGSSLNENVVLQEGQQLLGEGLSQYLTGQQLGRIELPKVNTDTSLASINSSSGDSLTLANNSRVSGIAISNSGGRGIVADQIEDFIIENIQISNSTGDAIFINSSSSGYLHDLTIQGGMADGIHIVDIWEQDADLNEEELKLESITISQTNGHGVHIDGGTGEIEFYEDLIISDFTGVGFLISNLETITETDDQGTDDTDDDVDTDIPGKVTVENLIVEGSTGGIGFQALDNEGQILLKEVDIQTEGGPALQLDNSEIIVIQDGTLSSKNGPFAQITNSESYIYLTSISADGGQYGAYFDGMEGEFLVYGDADADADELSGGSIQNTEIGIYMANSADVGLLDVEFDGNQVLAEVHDSEALDLSAVEVRNTSEMFVRANNLKLLNIQYSLFEDNSLTSTNGIEFTADTTGGFGVQVNNNTIEDSTTTFLSMRSLAGGESASLSSTFNSNSIELSHTSGTAATLDWTGLVNFAASNNLIVGDANNQHAFQMNLEDSNDSSSILFQQNGFSLTGNSSIAIDINSQAPGSFSFSENVIQFDGTDGIGIRLAAEKASNISFYANSLLDNAGGATAILIPTVYDGSSLAFNGNAFDLSRYNSLADRGIILNQVIGVDDDPFVYFSSSTDNLISGATTTYSIPIESVAGQLIINGTIYD